MHKNSVKHNTFIVRRNFTYKLRFAVQREFLPSTQNGFHICKLLSDFKIYNRIWY
jgi:hypothetical protein